MHLTYHFLRYLAPALSELFSGNTIIACFSQSKDELILETEGKQGSQFLRAHLLPPQVYLGFPTQFHRAKRNTVGLFDAILGDKINSCRVFSYERALKFELSSGKILVLKLHGNRSNFLLYGRNSQVPDAVFRNEIQEDKKSKMQESIQNILTLEALFTKKILYSLQRETLAGFQTPNTNGLMLLSIIYTVLLLVLKVI